MAVLKIAEYRLAQDSKGGFVAFRLRNPDGTISAWVKGGWFPIPFTQFPSLVGILTTGNAFYDDSKGLFLVSSREGLPVVRDLVSNLVDRPDTEEAIAAEHNLVEDDIGITPERKAKNISKPKSNRS